jgi:biotin transport system substrate-specific component
MALIANEVVTQKLIDIPFPSKTQTRDTLLVISFAVFVSIASQVSFTPPTWYTSLFSSIGIPINGTPVPITLQTLAVGLTGGVLGSKLAVRSLLLYMLAGMAGLPVYAGSIKSILEGEASFGLTNGSIWGGSSIFSLPSGGYILGFIVAAFIIGKLAEKGWGTNLVRTTLLLLIGHLFIYILGLPWLYLVLSEIPTLSMDLAKTLDFGLWPFIPGDIIKVVLTSLTLPSAWKLIQIQTKRNPS